MKKAHFTKQTKLAKQLIFVAVIALTFQSCIKDNFDTKKIAEVKWDANFAVPLVYSSLTMENILKKSKDFLHTESDGSLTLIYTTNVTSLDASSITTLQLPNQPAQNIAIATGPLSGVIPGGNSVSTVQTQTVAFTGAVTSTIDSIVFKAGTFDFSISSDIQGNVDLTIAIPSALKNGAPFSKTITLNYTGTTPVTASPSYDLTGYHLDMTQGGTTSNSFNVDYTVTVNGPATVTGAEAFQVGASMNNLAYSKFFGNLGQQTINIQPDTIPISIFKNAMGSASFTLADPTIKLIIYNSLGIPLTTTFPKLLGIKPNGDTINIPNTVPFPVTVVSPNIGQVGQTIKSETVLDTTNSNLATVLNNTPTGIVYALSAQTNTVSAGQNNFVLDTSHLKLDIEVSLPLEGTASNFILGDTLPFSAFEDQALSDNVSSALFRIFTSNGFPLDVDIQVYFVDSVNTKLDSLIAAPSSSLIIKSGPVDPTTKRVISSGITTPPVDITIDRAKLKKLSATKSLIIHAKATTTNAGTQDVKIYSDYKLEIKLGLQIQVDAKFNPNKK
jgi:hypothetical protein